MLQLQNISVFHGKHPALQSLDLSVKVGQWWMIIGPNGAGKSTLVEAISQTLPYQGKMSLLDQPMKDYSALQLARQVGMLSQHHPANYAFTVEEVAALGRYAYQRFLGGGDQEGREKIEQALALTGLTSLRRRSILTLSGGELQRAFLCQVLAQDPALLLLDEPANHLDLPYQKQIFQLVEQWLARKGRAVISVVHDLSLARRYGTHALLLKDGRCIAQGEKDQVLTRENLFQVYGMDVYQWMQEMLGQWQA